MTVEAAEPRSLLRRLYDWCLVAAHKPHALWTMGAVSFAESSFFPVPPDVMLIPMALARPERAYVMAAWCTVTSVLGGLLGYSIGALLYDSVGAWLINLYGYGDKVEAFREAYAQWGALIILIKGLTPPAFSCWPFCCTGTAIGRVILSRSDWVYGYFSVPQ
jgi:membrane protein YqaA with SNARE-associated domain